MKQTFNVLDNYNVPLYEEEKVSQLLENINSPNNDLKTEVTIFISRHSAGFGTASKYLSAVISCLLLATHKSSVRYGRRWQVNLSGKLVIVVRGGRF